MTRRQFFRRSTAGIAIGIPALATLLTTDGFGADTAIDEKTGGLAGLPHFPPKGRRVIFLHQSGAPSQIELFDFKPNLVKWQGAELPDSVRMGQRITGMTSGQSSFPVAPSIFKFSQYGRSGAWTSELLPYHTKIEDDITIIKSVYSEAINHDPAITFLQTGFQQPGRPSMGAWTTYGLGSENQNLPAFVVLISQANALNPDQPLFSRLWGSGFLPSRYQGVKFRASGDPVLYLSNPPGVPSGTRRRMLDGISKLNRLLAEKYGDPEIDTRVAQYEMAYRMQTSVPDLMDLSKEPESTFELYGPDSRKPGTYAANCLLARRLAERGVRFIQLYHRGWDQHNDLPRDIALQCKGVDQPSAALILDLKQRGMLDDTLVVWAGEFGRTVYCQGKLTGTNYGRDHHPRCFSIWMAGAGIQRGLTIGKTDDYCYNIVEDPVHVHDLQATILHCLGIDHLKLTYKFQGRYFRLTDVGGLVVKKILT
ncbi:MAG: sulfatase [Acidobacteria bacterium]|nr:MAG: sulfatase [Acidobacteriota bacterium]